MFRKCQSFRTLKRVRVVTYGCVCLGVVTHKRVKHFVVVESLSKYIIQLLCTTSTVTKNETVMVREMFDAVQ